MSTSGGVPVAQWPAATVASGGTFEPVPGGALGTVTVSGDQCALVPMLVTADISVASLSVWVGTAGSAGAVARLGIYRDNGNGKPGPLLTDAGTVDATVTGLRTLTPTDPIKLIPGWYWTAVAFQGEPTTQPVYAGYVSPISMGTMPGGVFSYWNYTVNLSSSPTYPVMVGVSGALPDPATGLFGSSHNARMLLTAA